MGGGGIGILGWTFQTQYLCCQSVLILDIFKIIFQ